MKSIFSGRSFEYFVMKLLNGFDKDLSECLEKSMTSLGIDLKFRNELKNIRKRLT